MKWGSIIFATLMFAVLFGAPVVQTFMDDDSMIVFQESEEKDAEEGEDVKLKDTFEALYYSNSDAGHKHFALKTAQLQPIQSSDLIVMQKGGVDTPPPEAA